MPALVKDTLFEFLPDEPEPSSGADGQTAAPHVERVLLVEPPGLYMWSIDIHAPSAWPVRRQRGEVLAAIEAGTAQILVFDPYVVLARREKDIPKDDRADRDEAWKIIEPLVKHPSIFFPSVRGPLVAEASRASKGTANKETRVGRRQGENGYTKSTVYGWLRRYWQRGQTQNSLLPDYEHCGAKGKERRPPTEDSPKRGHPSELADAGGPPGINASPDVVAHLKRGYELYYLTRDKLPWTVAFRKTLRHFFRKGWKVVDGKYYPIMPPAEELPTLRQFRYHNMKDRDLERELRAREGDRYYETNLRPLLSTPSILAIGPAWLFEFDWTSGGMMLVSGFDRTLRVGQATVYIVIDVFSCLIVGLYVGLEEPSWLAAMLALENAMTDKVDYCKEFGIEIDPEDWPYCCPTGITGDRGELEGFSANNIPCALGVEVHNTRPYGPEWKAIVENAHNDFQRRIVRGQPGEMQRDIARGDPDPVDDACVSRHEFTRLMIFHVLDHNAEHRIKDYPLSRDLAEDHVEPYPLDLWRWGIQRSLGSPRRLPREIVRLNLLPDGDASVSRGGIYFRKLWYGSELAMRKQWYLKSRNGRLKITVAYEPRLVDAIYIRGDRGELLDRCVLLPESSRFAGLSWAEVEAQLKQERLDAADSASRTLHAQINFDTRVDHEVEEARQKTREAGKGTGRSRRERKTGLRDNRGKERDADRKTGAWDVGRQGTTGQPTAELDKAPGEPGTPEYVGPPENLEKLSRILRKPETEVQSE